MHVRKRIFYILVFVILAGLAGLLGIAQFINSFLSQPLNIPAQQVFEIKLGEPANKVMQRLAAVSDLDELVASRLWFKANPDAAQFKAGIYDLVPRETVEDVLNRFHQGDTKNISLTLVEGQTWREWKNQISYVEWLQKNVSYSDLLSQINTISGWQVTHLEGIMMPDTYQVEAGSDPLALLLRSHQRMSDFLSAAWEQRQIGLPLASPYEALVLASIIEKETGIAEERSHISAVFVNRLNKGMRLQTDPTVIYGLGEAFDGNLTKAHLREKTPYNTYRINGLPPTPIAMPGKAAILAALNPSQSEDLYFVAKGDGSHQFSATLEEHNAAVRRYQLGLH